MVKKNDKPVDNLDKIKRIRATIKHVVSPAEEIPVPDELRRKNVMWLELQWLKMKSFVRDKSEDFAWYLNTKVDLVIKESVSKILWVVIPIGALVVIAMIIKGC